MTDTTKTEESKDKVQEQEEVIAEAIAEEEGEEVEGLIQHEAYKERNDLNSLNPRAFRAFLLTVEEGTWSNKEDVEFSVKSYSIPTPTIADVVQFFTKTSGSMLHVFCGSGRIAANICAHAEIQCTGITLLERDIKRYEDRIKNDMFAEEFPIIIGDAVEVLEKGEGLDKYEFILVDPPRFGLIDSPVNSGAFARKSVNIKEDINPQDVRCKSKEEFFDYLAQVIDLSALYLKEGGYIAALIDDQFYGKEYICTGAHVANRVKSLGLRGVKIYTFLREGQSKGNFGKYMPIFNHHPIYIFQPL